MKTFTDTEGRHWNLKGSLGAFERVKTSCDVDLLDLPTTQECLRKISDVFTLGKVLYVMCEDQAEARGVTPEQFADGFNADVLHEASEALIEEVIFFCRKDVRPALEMAFAKAKAADRKAAETMRTRIHSLEREMDAAMESLLTSTDFATSLPASSESTPANGRSAASSGRPRAPKKSGGTIRAAS
jgi:hypothetical protein